MSSWRAGSDPPAEFLNLLYAEDRAMMDGGSTESEFKDDEVVTHFFYLF